jgi:TolB-like protein/DNA-binding SARP family transcriptional activator
MFELRTLGSLDLTSSAGRPVSSVLVRPRRVALLCYLALGWPRAFHRRETLLALFWPERATEPARHALRQAVYVLRRGLGADAIVSRGDDSIAIAPERVRCDAAEFERALEEGRLNDGLALYRGDLLPGFHISGAPDFDRWLEDERSRLKQRAGEAAWGLAEARQQDGDASAAAKWARLAASFSPGDETSLRRLVALLDDLGDRTAALRAFEAFAWRLEQQYELEPSAETRSLVARVRARQAEGAATRLDETAGARRPARPAGSSSTPHRSPPAIGPHEPLPAPVEVLDAADDRAGAIQQARIDAAPLEQEFAAEPDREVAGFAERLRTTPARRTEPESPRLRPGGRRLLAPAVALAGLLAVVAAGSLLLKGGGRSVHAREGAASPHAIAVLPCANLNRDPDEEFFSDGLTEELIGVLSRVGALRVAARTSTFAFKGRDQDIRAIGEALSVGTLLECGVRRDGERVRVTAQLINADDGLHLWADTYEHEGPDVFAIQTDLALRIAAALRAELTPAERARLGRRPTSSPEAHTLYLKGRHFWNQRTSAAYVRAIEYFERAIRADPQYAAAWAGLASAYSMQGLSGDLAPAESSRRTRDAARQAVALDDALAEAHTALGGYLHAHAWDSDAAERAHRRALELDPNYPTAHHWYGNFLRSMGRFDEALARFRQAAALDPLDPHLSSALGEMLLVAGHTADGVHHIRNALEVDSTFWQAHADLGTYYAEAGRLDEAIRSHRRAVELGGDNSYARVQLARVLAVAGRADEARETLEALQADAVRTGLYPPHVAVLLLALGDVDAAMDWLERAYQQRHPGLRFIGGSIAAASGDDPRFIDLRQRVGLPR